ncbi:nucleotide-binding protein [Corynebacterium sp. A21]
MILTVANFKGGSGRTTTSPMLAQVASEHGTRVRV